MQQTVENWDSGLVARTKINENFSELYPLLDHKETTIIETWVPLSVSGTTAEVNVYTGVIPAWTFWVGSKLYVEFWSWKAWTAWTLTPRLKIGGVLVQSVAHTAAILSATNRRMMINRGVLNSQIATAVAQNHPYQTALTAFPTYSFDTALLVSVEITLQLSNAADTGRIDFLSIRVEK